MRDKGSKCTRESAHVLGTFYRIKKTIILKGVKKTDAARGFKTNQVATVLIGYLISMNIFLITQKWN